MMGGAELGWPRGLRAPGSGLRPESEAAEGELTVSSGALLRLLQLTSPALPIGAFAYSQGLEQGIERRWVHDEATLLAWLGGVFEQVLGFVDLPLLVHAHAAWRDPDPEAPRRVARWVLALRETSELRAEEQHLGSALARVLCDQGISAAEPFCGDRQASYLVSFALACVSWSISPQVMLMGFSYAWIESQVSVAARVIPLGQLAAQRVLAATLERVPLVVHAALSLPDQEIGRSAFGIALLSAWHEKQYSRLFRS